MRKRDVKDITGIRYGRLVAIRHSGFYMKPSGKRSAIWECLCDCGNICNIRSTSLHSGDTKSCGCLGRYLRHEKPLEIDPVLETFRKISKTTDQPKRVRVSGTRTHNTYKRMKGRCRNKNDPHYHMYGGCGITVCERWLESFDNFLEDMGERPEGTSLDRINGKLGYFKENCRWATPTEQAFNQKIKNIYGKSGIGRYANGDYKASISKEGRNWLLGRFETLEEAIEIRELAELELYGCIKS